MIYFTNSIIFGIIQNGTSAGTKTNYLSYYFRVEILPLTDKEVEIFCSKLKWHMRHGLSDHVLAYFTVNSTKVSFSFFSATEEDVNDPSRVTELETQTGREAERARGGWS